jgi:hypothetical protein
MECGRRNRQSRGILDRRNAVISSDALGPSNILNASPGAGPIEADNSVVHTTAPPDDALRQLNR